MTIVAPQTTIKKTIDIILSRKNDLMRSILELCPIQTSHCIKKNFALLRERKAATLLDQFKHYKTAHKVDRELQFWQEGSHPELIANDLMLRQKVKYIHLNPVKRGYVDQAEHRRYSSARSYLGSVGLLEIRCFS